MTPVRRQRRGRSSDFVALRGFARAYLHEDVVREYGSAVRAVHAFTAVASVKERAALAADLAAVAAQAADWPADRLRAFFTDTLGAAWAAPSADVVRQMADAAVDRRDRDR